MNAEKPDEVLADLEAKHGSVQRLVMRLERIAKKNHDQFRYKIEVRPVRNGLEYRFVCQESADNHELLIGVGSTLEQAICAAATEVEAACQEWDYDAVA